MKSKYFYSEEQLEEFRKDLLETNLSIRSLAKTYAEKYGRGFTGIQQKLFKIAQEVTRPSKIVKAKRSPNKAKVAKIDVIKQNQPFSIDVPEGTSFDIKNVKRVVLQKDCFTIYF
jgi:hypothetical protein